MSEHVCPSSDDLKSFVVGRLSEPEIAALAEHLDACASCASTIEAIEEDAGTSDGLVRALRNHDEGSQSLDPAEERAINEMVTRIESITSLPSTATVAWGESATPQPEPRPEPRSSTEMEIKAGARLGQYQLLDKLGEGGMGAVYKARHLKLKREVAVKVLAGDRTANRAAVARFHREMEAVGKLDHPNIVRALDADEDGGTHYLVMEYVPGSDLARLVKRLGPLPIADACELVRQAAVGLQHAHENGLVHRDIKPSNLILTRTSAPVRGETPGQGAVVKVLDLGLARLQDDHSRPAGETNEASLTGTGQMMGTPEFISPEQVHDTHDVDIRADIYSLGCTLYHLLAGKPPFSGEKYRSSFLILMAHTNETVPPIRDTRSDVPGDLAAVLGRMLAKDRAYRYQEPADVAEALRPFTAGSNLARLLMAHVAKDDLATMGSPDASTLMPVPPMPAVKPIVSQRRGRHAGRWAVGAALAACVVIVVAAIWATRSPDLVPSPVTTPATPIADARSTDLGYRTTQSQGEPRPAVVPGDSESARLHSPTPAPAPAPPAAPPLQVTTSPPRPASNSLQPPASSLPAAGSITPPGLRNDFGIKVEFLTGTASAQGVRLREDDRIELRIQAEKDCYVGIWWIEEGGTATQLFPNEYEPEHLVRAGQARRVPGNPKYSILATASTAPEHFRVIASTHEWQPAPGRSQGGYRIFETAEELVALGKQLDEVRGARLAPAANGQKPLVAEAVLPFEVGGR